MTRLAKELDVVAAMAPAELRAKWQDMGAGELPSLPVGLLRRLLVQMLQEKRLGRLPLLVVRELECVAVGGVPRDAQPRPLLLTPGTRLIREWNGKTISVEVREEGFLWRDRTWRSLSEVAREVTGAHWSGPRFFGLNRRG